MAKRAFDFVVSGLLLLAVLVPMLVIALAIKLDSAGPVFFRQQRVGRYGSLFSMLKFRSMVRDASAKGPYYTDKGDPRITRVGGFLRRTSLDELPQLINVMLGDMSLVGPRPDVPEQRALYTDNEWRERCSVRPGITGLSQADKRSSATPEERLAKDIEYVRSQSFWLDIQILVATARQVLLKGGY